MLVVGFVVYREPEWQVKTCLLNVYRVYGSSLEKVIIITKEPLSYSLAEFSNLEVIDYPNNQKQQYLNMQFLYRAFLEKSASDYLITIDPDTLVLEWDGEYTDLRGSFVYYRAPRLINYWNQLSPIYQRLFQHLTIQGCLHSVQGGWSLRSRFIVEQMLSIAYPDPEDWASNPFPLVDFRGRLVPIKALQYHSFSDLRTLPRERGHHEMVFGYYLKALFLQKKVASVKEYLGNERLMQKRYPMFLPESFSLSLLRRAQAVHPIKTKEKIAHIQRSRPDVLIF